MNERVPYAARMANYLLVIGDRQALDWVLRQQRMAFPDFKRAEVRALAPGDRLYLYTTRGCFGNPTRDRGRVVTTGEVRSTVAELDEPVELGGRSYPVGCELRITELPAWPGGVELSPIVGELELFDGMTKSWSIRLRRPLVGLSARDAGLLDRYLAEHDRYPLDEMIDGYRPRRRASRG
ncbi:hypothetical protein SAMN04487820_108200 [Actinopolyspora mzabensis]|uniref:EVE domain-containing protein n=2 Tax=Actinopolyspora mzabensis TaxID=995066 RepID=A0A1G9C9R7_ACTMZ|nr:hypothetical protein SAMN04487820_108200 [Actinopolyspora mzabensis]